MPATPPTLPTTTQALSQLSISTTDSATDTTTTVSSPQTTTPLHIRSDSIESTTSTSSSDGHDLVKRDMDFFLARMARRDRR